MVLAPRGIPAVHCVRHLHNAVREVGDFDVVDPTVSRYVIVHKYGADSTRGRTTAVLYLGGKKKKNRNSVNLRRRYPVTQNRGAKPVAPVTRLVISKPPNG